ncbi:MAG: CDP-alcohol phosphatidyltransferase family protein [Tannerellaceae bacterium]|nr:CDP-alcohol phosphatidyltransferase family protein [Tannerellaceae bacterium]
MVDRMFYRPIGFLIARALRHTRITPNMVTVLSIFVGASAGLMFYSADRLHTLYGILLLVAANILDCVDGQLARLTGIKSAIGRILDGLAGDIWFTCIYVCLALRLSHEYGTFYFFLLAVISGLSHLAQANITDYYKTLHLYFISKEKGSEFQTLEQVRMYHKETRPGLNKVFYLLYRAYTLIQVKATPSLQRMLKSLHARYDDEIPEDIRVSFRRKSGRLMSYIDLLTFNGRTIVLFAILLTGYVWVYFLYEIIVLNIVLMFVMRKHERMCASFL